MSLDSALFPPGWQVPEEPVIVKELDYQHCTVHEDVGLPSLPPAVKTVRRLYETGEHGRLMHVCDDCHRMLLDLSKRYQFDLEIVE